MLARLVQDAADDVETVRAAGMGDLGFGRILGREGGQRRRADVGRIGQDQIVTAAGKGGEQIGAE